MMTGRPHNNSHPNIRAIRAVSDTIVPPHHDNDDECLRLIVDVPPIKENRPSLTRWIVVMILVTLMGCCSLVRVVSIMTYISQQDEDVFETMRATELMDTTRDDLSLMDIPSLRSESSHLTSADADYESLSRQKQPSRNTNWRKRRKQAKIPAWTQIQYDPTQVDRFLLGHASNHPEGNKNGQPTRVTVLPHSNATNLHGQHHAMIIPYRDRQYHLQEFLRFLQVYLSYQYTNGTFSLWVMEQADSQPFNRAWLGNVGLDQIMRQSPHTHCVTLHDVDMVPGSLQLSPAYHECETPTQLAQAKNGFDLYMGGVTVMSLAHWKQINGLSNDYVGWGGEDTDLYHRLRLNGLLSRKRNRFGKLLPRTPALPQQRNFQLIAQETQHHTSAREHGMLTKNQQLVEEMRQGSSRWKEDGLKDLHYTVTEQEVVAQVVTDSIIDAIHHIHAVP